MLQIKVKKSDFQQELGLVQSVVEKRATIPILSNILIESSEAGIIIHGTDLDVSLQTQCPAVVDSSGGVAIDARKLFEIVRSLPEAEIHLKGDENNRVSLQCERVRFKIAGLGKENFPQIPKFPSARLSIPGGTFKACIARTIFATTQEESRYALSGIQLEALSDNVLRMVATDGHRLAIVDKQIETSLWEEGLKVLIPKKALHECSKLIANPDEFVDISVDENHVYFRVGHRELAARLLTGQFPNYEMVLPKDNDRIAQVSSEAIAAALRRVSLVSDERSHAVKLAFQSGRIELTSRGSVSDEEAVEDLLADYEGDPFEISFNSRYLLDFFNVVDAADVRIELMSNTSPALIRPAAEQEGYRYVVMPMRV